MFANIVAWGKTLSPSLVIGVVAGVVCFGLGGCIGCSCERNRPHVIIKHDEDKRPHHRQSEEPPIATRYFNADRILAELNASIVLAPVVIDPPPCPVTDKDCDCGCADGKPCTCGKKPDKPAEDPQIAELRRKLAEAEKRLSIAEAAARKPLPKKAAAPKGQWASDTDGSADIGYWKGGAPRGIYRPSTGSYYPYDGSRYLGPIQLTAPQTPVGYVRTCDGRHCTVTPIYSTTPPAVEPPE